MKATRLTIATAFKLFPLSLCFVLAPLNVFAQDSATAESQFRFPATKAPAVASRVQSGYAELPLAFEPNRGQFDVARFRARGSGYSLFLTDGEAVFRLRRSPRAHAAKSGAAAETTLRMKLLGANPQPQIAGEDGLPGTVNYFRGNDPTRGRTNVPTYAKVRYSRVYPGIDLLYYGNQRRLEYDFVVAPRADPGRIMLAFAGAKRARLDSTGDLKLELESGSLRWRRPVCYQEIGGKRRYVPGNYILKGRNQIGFQVAKYDRSRPLVIDPVLVYGAYLGGSGGDYGQAIAVDAVGNAYVVGITISGNFPTTPGAYSASYNGNGDVFVTKISPTGAHLIYSTYVAGSINDLALGVAVDAAGNAYVTGRTSSANFPVTAGAYQQTFTAGSWDAFVFKLNPTGSALVYSTFLGGTQVDGAMGIALDAAGNAYVTGSTTSADFPTTASAYQKTFAGVTDTFVTKLNATGSALIYSTLLGGSQHDDPVGIAVDGAGNAYVVGNTASTDYPVTAGALATTAAGLFVTKLNPTGSALVYSTYFGGSNYVAATALAVDRFGNAYVTGSTSSTDFPTTAGAYQTTYLGTNEAFVSKLNATGSALVYSTLLGSRTTNWGEGIAVDSAGNAHVAWYSQQATVLDKSATVYDTNAYVSVFNPTGTALLNSTALDETTSFTNIGAGVPNPGDFPTGIAIGPAGDDYVVGNTLVTYQFPPTLHATPGVFANNEATSNSDTVFVSRVHNGPYVRFDYNFDNKPDILFQNTQTGAINVWYMDGARRLGAEVFAFAPSVDRRVLAAADFNGDGQNDLLVQDQKTGVVYIWLMQGLMQTSEIRLYTLNPIWKIVGVADFNGDGDPDILLQKQTTGQIAVWIMNGTTIQTLETIRPALSRDWDVVGAADYNGDGKPDLLFRNNKNGTVACWFLNGITVTGATTIYVGLSLSWQIVGVADLNHDGYADILFQSTGNGQIAYWQMRGTRITTSVTIVPSLDLRWQVVGER